MKTTHFAYIVLCLVMAVTVFSLIGLEEDYVKALLKERKHKDKEFTSSSSPLSAEKRAHFKGLHYYQPNLDYRIEAKFILNKLDTPIEISTSTGAKRKYKVFGKANFELSGQQLSLELYSTTIKNETHLFVPFSDLTNGVETYGAGRYLDVNPPQNQIVVLDFNRAYAPYCAYSDGYDCPKPPQANHLKVEIKAGEKILD